MKIKDYMNKLIKAENGDYNDLILSIHEDDFLEEVKPNEFFIPYNLWGKRNAKEEEIYKRWETKIGEGTLQGTPFNDACFLRTFLEDIKEEEQFLYVYNTVLYLHNKQGYDPHYVLVTRRSLPTMENKPEQFWTTDYIGPMNGLSNEIPKGSPHRLHSVILVTTLEKLQKYGFAFNHGGRTDGEIMIEYKDFDRDDILFVHKSAKEIVDLIT